VPRKLSRLHKPETMSLEAWQIVLRRQVGREETFTLTNVGETNPSSRSSTSPIRRAGTPTGSSFAAASPAPMSARVPTSRRIRSAPASTSSSFQKKSKKGIARPKKVWVPGILMPPFPGILIGRWRLRGHAPPEVGGRATPPREGGGV